jgi:hypothetical protein
VPYMVIHQAGSDQPGYLQLDDLDAAVQQVEHLRNDAGVDQARIYRMEEVAFEFRPYYRVELGAAAAGESAATPEAGAAPADAAEVPEDATADNATADDAVPPSDRPALAAVESDPTPTPTWIGARPPGDATSEPSNGAGSRRGLFGR